MASPTSSRRVGGAARAGLAGTIVAAVAFFDGVFINPILVGTLARFVAGEPIGERRILLGSIAYAVPYVAMWTLVGLALGGTVRAV